jgi:hypothetical protein
MEINFFPPRVLAIPLLEDLEKQATMSGKERSEHKGLHCHELNKDIE